jgi:sec-independent protein translocase protein TatA
MGGFSIWHILILAIILLLLFGGNRFSSMMGDVAKGLKSFKQGMADEDEEKQRRFDEQRRYDEQRRAEPPRQLPRDQDPIDVTPRREEPVAPPPASDDEPR